MTSKLHCLFSPHAKHLLVSTTDNRIKLWDVDTKKETRNYIEKRHLSHSYTCWSWGYGKKDSLGLFATGTSDGTVILWDLVRGVVIKEIGSADSAVASDVSISKDAKQILVSSSSLNQIIIYDIASGTVVKVNS